MGVLSAAPVVLGSAAPVVLGAAVSALPGVLSLFQRDLTATARDHDINFPAVAATLANSLSKNDGWQCYVRNFRPVPQAGVFEDSQRLQARRERLRS